VLLYSSKDAQSVEQVRALLELWLRDPEAK
jgi:hypothetical protein